MANLETYLQRIVDLANDLTEIGTASLTYPDEVTTFMESSLPYVFVEEGQATYERAKNQDTWEVTREVRSLIYVALINPETEANETTGRATARSLLRTYVLHFMKRDRLQRAGDNGPDGDLYHARVLTDGGVQTADRNSKVYVALDVRHQLVYRERVTEA